MRANEFLTEGNSMNLLVIDVQPEYHDWCQRVLPGVQQMISKATGKVVIVFNDFGGGDTPEQVFSYLAGNDPEDDGYYYDEEEDDYFLREQTPIEQKLQNAQFVQKEFGFLRPMMDQGVSDRTIIQVLRLMYQQRANDSRDIDYDMLPDEIKADLEQNNFDWDSEGIYAQEWVPVHMLKQLSPFYMMGGGRNECLREIELICNAFNIKYKRVESLVY